MEIPNLSSGLTTLLYSLAHAVSINIIVFFDVPSSVRSGLQAMQSVVNRFSQPQKSFSSYFSTIFLRSQFVVQHYVSCQSSSISTVHFTASTFKVLLCHATYTYQLSYILFLLAFCTQIGGGALFLYAPLITCICHIPLIA